MFSYGPENEFETAMVNEPSVFEPVLLYFYVESDYTHQQLQFSAIHYRPWFIP